MKTTLKIAAVAVALAASSIASAKVLAIMPNNAGGYVYLMDSEPKFCKTNNRQFPAFGASAMIDGKEKVIIAGCWAIVGENIALRTNGDDGKPIFEVHHVSEFSDDVERFNR